MVKNIMEEKYKAPTAELLASLPLEILKQQAQKIKLEQWGDVITYSRKVFVPLTNMCRDTCGYCTFVKHPDDPAAEIITKDQVLAIAKEGQKKGCKELLFSLGEKPELRYQKAKAALAKLGYSSIIDYLADMCQLVLDETSLLPHVNAGTLTPDEIVKLKPVAASMGMMLETVSKRLTKIGMAHYACPDKMPVQRLRTLERTGALNVPFTTGLLIGIGETWQERIDSLYAIAKMHKKYGHIQEVIVQNFMSKPGIEMQNHPEPSLDDMLRTLCAARLILPPDISLQAPPNLSNRHVEYLSAGINDWGGISPITIDFINPQNEWPEIRELAKSTERFGGKLQERLTVYPKYIQAETRFIDKSILPRIFVQARSDGLAQNQEVTTS